ncbi:unnamed protein product [Rhizoctonia solani]|uniref:Major facilitator superfamily (MFS) profile domain-containing protein n=1 Tax=Rhizoctonia solani TaxID=456999 RepID=A0A8H3E5E7_9AGAM|nr:unnamed protein product [Rhizoctonia solani]
MSGQDMRLQPGTDAPSSPRSEPGRVEIPNTTLSDVERAVKTEVDALPAFGAPIPAQPIVDELDKDDLFPEGGRGWLVVLGCFMLSSMTLGFGLCWGVFQEYYRHNILVGTSDSVLGLLGSTQGAVGTLSSLFIGKLGDR